MNYKELILNKLLDKFEKSKSYLENTNRRIILKLDNLKEYNIQNYEEKVLFHEIVKDLKNKGLVDFSWVKFEQDNIMEQIWLIKENVEMAYAEIKRTNPKQSYIEIFENLNKAYFSQNWIQTFKIEMLQYMEKYEKENTLLPKAKYKEIIRALQEIDELQCSNVTEDYRIEMREEAEQSKTIAQNTMLKRIFSMKCYNNSKFFEKEVQSNLIRIIKKYYKNENLDLTELNDDELLAEIGIVRYPEIIEFCGNMKCLINGKKLEFSDVCKGSYINSYSVLNMEKIELIGVKRVVFIENKTNYISYIENKEKDEFVIYHGGVYSPIKGEFFRKIYEAVLNNNVKCDNDEIIQNKNNVAKNNDEAIYNNEVKQNNCNLNQKNDVEFWHWSDIDIGGFNMFTRLRDNIIHQLKPLKMDVKTLVDNKSSWQSFDIDYKERLLKLRQMKRYECFFDVIDIMLENNARLEQESLI